MRLVTSHFDAELLARGFFSTLVFTILLLLTACAENHSASVRTALAPPPPFVTAQDNNSTEISQERFGPEAPLEMAMVQAMAAIEPTAGAITERLSYVQKCKSASFRNTTAPEFSLDFGGVPHVSAGELSFNSVYSGHDSAGMSIRLTMALPGVKSAGAGCR